MIAYRNLYLSAIIGMMVGIGSGFGAAQTPSDSASFSTPTASNGTSVTAPATSHKTSHRKKKKSAATASATGPANAATASTAPATTTSGASTTGGAAPQAGAVAKTTTGKKTAAAKSSRKKSKSKLAKVPKPPALSPIDIPGGVTSTPISAYPPIVPSGVSSVAPVTVTKSAGDMGTQITISAPASSTHPAGGPEVDTGLPVARHSAIPPDGSTTSPHQSATTYQIASAFPISPAISTLGSYTPVGHVKNPVDNFVFTNFNRRARNTYPWKLDIITTVFWIGENTPNNISTTDNIASAWDQDWRSNNGGTDTPNDREGYFPANHAARMNPFYVALPFNDLAFPDKARHWLPAGWYRPPRDGKQVSACKDRWVEIKNAQGETCYAQWEDVGPLRYDHAEYVFGDERPDTYTRAGLDVSPAVADYLNITGRNRLTRWRFVDDADVQPGMWLKYDEEALIFKAMHDIKNEDPTRVLPIQRATAPIDDDNDSDANKKRLNAAKG